jgi:N-acetylmuramoyl-L-alanine amidase
VLKVGKLLEANLKVDVIYTKKRQILLIWLKELILRIELMPHIFVSIHCNANRNTAADGTETYVMGMNKIASNLEKKENSVITLEKDYKKENTKVLTKFSRNYDWHDIDAGGVFGYF